MQKNEQYFVLVTQNFVLIELGLEELDQIVNLFVLILLELERFEYQILLQFIV
jgi:hypothetical protein